MDRRQALRLLGSSAAFAGLSPTRLAALADLDQPVRPIRAFFTAEQREAVDALGETIIPTTDTPGAITAGVTDFIEAMVADWYDAPDRERFMRGLAHVDEHAEALTGVRYAYADPAVQRAILEGLEAEGEALRRESRRADGDALPVSFFHQLKDLVLHGYYTSQVGMRQELLYRPLPGRFDGCADVTEVTRG